MAICRGNDKLYGEIVGENGRAPKEYSSEAIWYSFDIRPNAPRVYFVVKDASEKKLATNQNLIQTQNVWLYLAITDKKSANICASTLDWPNRAYLVAHGAGSI